MNEQRPYKRIRRFFSRIEKEEKWLNDMSAQGWNLLQVSELGSYIFTYDASEKRKYRIDYRFFKTLGDFDDYTTLFWDSGWNLVSGGKSRGSQYFYSTNPEKNDDIFSDERSRAGRYIRMARHTLWLTLLMCSPYLFVWPNRVWDFSLSPYQQYQIAELSYRTGFEYLNTLLALAVPFFLQGAFCICAIVMLFTCLFYFVKARVCYRKATNTDIK